MKLLFDATEISYYQENSGHKAGVFYVALNLLKEFQKQGIDITFHCDFKRYYFLKNIKEFSQIPCLEEHSLINKIIAWVLFKTDNFPLRIKYGLIILARIYDKYFYKTNTKNLNRLKDFDVYFSPFTPPSKEILQSNLKRFRMLHDVIPIIEQGLPKSPKDWYYKIYSTINSQDYYVTNSEFTKQDVLKYFPFIKENNIKTTLLGANTEFYPTQEKLIEEDYIFSLCTLGKRKNLIFAIKNFFKFIEKHKIENLKLVLGGGVWKKFEKELNSVLNQHDNTKIILTGYIDEKDLKKYYSNALCFIYPSLYEGFGLPVLEAMQCGCPVITSDRTSLPEVIGDCGIIINPESDEDMINAYEKMYFDSGFRKKCSDKGLERAKTFSWQKCAFEILEFIKSTY
ncbi:glycosyltransferase family 4 protein [bacterium]|nr:glycosyltransferase family 4 protein [bacterium]